MRVVRKVSKQKKRTIRDLDGRLHREETGPLDKRADFVALLTEEEQSRFQYLQSQGKLVYPALLFSFSLQFFESDGSIWLGKEGTRIAQARLDWMRKHFEEER